MQIVVGELVDQPARPEQALEIPACSHRWPNPDRRDSARRSPTGRRAAHRRQRAFSCAITASRVTLIVSPAMPPTHLSMGSGRGVAALAMLPVSCGNPPRASSADCRVGAGGDGLQFVRQRRQRRYRVVQQRRLPVHLLHGGADRGRNGRRPAGGRRRRRLGLAGFPAILAPVLIRFAHLPSLDTAFAPAFSAAALSGAAPSGWAGGSGRFRHDRIQKPLQRCRPMTGRLRLRCAWPGR